MKVFLAGTASRKWVLYENISCGAARLPGTDCGCFNNRGGQSFLAGKSCERILNENLSCRRKREESDSFENARKRERERDGDAAGVADENISCRRSSVEGGARQNI